MQSSYPTTKADLSERIYTSLKATQKYKNLTPKQFDELDAKTKWTYLNCNYEDVRSDASLGTICGTVIIGLGGPLKSTMANMVVRVTNKWHYSPKTDKNRDPDYHFNIQVPGTAGKPDIMWHVYTSGQSGTLGFDKGKAIYHKQPKQPNFTALKDTPKET